MDRARALLAALALLFVAGPAGAVDKDNPFAAKAVCPTGEVDPGGTAELGVDYEVFSKDYYIYRDMSDVRVDEAGDLSAGDIAFPKGKVKFDKISESEREIFEHDFRVAVPVTVPADAAGGDRTVKFNAKWQGCNKPENYCLFPANVDLECVVKVSGDSPESTSTSVGDSEGDDPVAEGDDPVAEGDEPVAEGDDPVAEGDEPAAEGDEPTAEGDEPTAEGDEPTAEGDEPESGDAVVAAGSDAPPQARVLGAATPASDACAGTAVGTTGVVAKITAWLEGKLAGSTAGGAAGPGLLFLLLVFAGGMASSLTPCVYPMIPITISVIGASADQGRMKSFSLACVYVLGICATYTVLGVAAAGSGEMFGSALQNPWVLAVVGVVMLILALSMFGMWEFALPSGMTNKASMIGGGGGYVGAFLVGTVAGVVAAPCTGPIVLMLLTVIGTNGWAMAPSALVMFIYSLGLGMLFLGVGTFAGSLPRSGAWMDTVKHVFGVILVGAAAFYGGQMVSVMEAGGSSGGVVGTGHVLVTIGWVITAGLAAWVIAGERDVFGEDRHVGRAVAGFVVLLLGLYFVLAPEPEHEGIVWSDQYETTLAAAADQGRPIILDFTADWCAACKELEHKTYTDPAVLQCSDEFERVMVDGTTDTPEFVALKEQYGIKGLPAVYFLCPEGDVVPELTLKGFEPADSFLEKMNRALNTCNDDGRRAEAS